MKSQRELDAIRRRLGLPGPADPECRGMLPVRKHDFDDCAVLDCENPKKWTNSKRDGPKKTKYCTNHFQAVYRRHEKFKEKRR